MNPTLQTTIVVVLIVAALGYRIYRQTREQRWSVKTMWIAPGIFAAITVVAVAGDATRSWWAILSAVVGAVAGTALGFYQGNHTTLRVDKAAGLVFVKIAPIGMLLFIGILVLRIARGFSTLAGTNAQAMQSGALAAMSPGEAVAGSALLALAVGSIVGLRWYVQRAYSRA